MRAVLLVLLLLSSPAFAVEPGEMLRDPVLEARAREITRVLRCPVCEGQDIDDSRAALAGDLRRLVREKVKAGATDVEIFAFLADRYGEQILMEPPVAGRTLVLWVLPGAVFVAGLGAAFALLRRRVA